MTGKNKIVIVGLLASLAAVVVRHVRLVRWLGIYAQANEHLTARVEELKAEKDVKKRGLVPIEEHPEFEAIYRQYGPLESARLNLSDVRFDTMLRESLFKEVNKKILQPLGLNLLITRNHYTCQVLIEGQRVVPTPPPAPLANIKESNFRIDEIPGADIRPAIALLRKYVEFHGIGIDYKKNPAGWFDVRLFSKKEAEVGYDEKTGRVIVSATMFVSPEDWPGMQAQAFLGMFSDKVLSRFGLRALVTRNAVTGVGISVERAGQPSRPAPREGDVAVESSGGIQTS